MSRLALAMIVRNEAARLPAFLAHHAGLADEIVITDTGSEDGTVAVAEAAGAVVVRHPWADDFAAARNAGLGAVTADWILFLDADERIATADFGRVREVLAGPPQAYLQESWNYCPFGSHLEWRPLSGRYPAEEEGQEGLFVARRVGIFPRRDGLHFSGRVHESVLPAVRAAGLPVVALDVPVHHYGFASGEAAGRERRQRYRGLLERKHADDPGDPAAGLELASLRLEEGDTAGALRLLESVVAGPAGLRPVVRGHVLLARLRREGGDVEAARVLLAEAVRQDPDFVFAHVEALRTAAEAGHWDEAERLLAAAQGRFGADDPLLLREAVRVHIHGRRLVAAREAAARVVESCPAWTDMRDLLARLKHMTDDPGAR